MVMAPASTGRESSKRIAVKNTLQTNRGIWSHLIPDDCMLIIVVIKLTAPRIDEAPAKWRLKIDRSTDLPAWAKFAERGG